MILSNGEIIFYIQSITRAKESGIRGLPHPGPHMAVYATITGPWGEGIVKSYLDRWRKGFQATQALDIYLYEEFNKLVLEGKLLL